ncbi:MAG: 1-acyl-sn-glycerol-3-phosphate acyltransferase [Micrococcales bacterium]|nr:1-acyl-sn-glycerol-3-phosphate acyltransferase [Micrococcales bacterium]
MFYWLVKAVVAPFMRAVYHPWSRGTEHIPSKGPAILAGNHLAVIDSFFLPILVPRRVYFIAKADYFTGKGVKGRLVAGFMRGLGMIPVDRSGGKAALASLNQGLQVLQSGHLFGIYPEGTRSPDGRLYRGKTGVARLAIESGAPVIPVAMIGTNLAQPVGKRIPKRVRIGLVIGQPLDFSRYAGREDDRFVLRSVTDEIMYALMELSGQEYIDVYAATMKARLAAGAPAPEAESMPIAPGGRPRPAGLEAPEPPDTPPASEDPNPKAGAAGPEQE